MKLEVKEILNSVQKWKPRVSGASFSSRSKLVGLDIGHRNIKGIKLSKKGSQVILEQYYFTDMAQVFQKFPEGRDPLQVIKALTEIHQLAGASTASALPDHQVYSFDLTLPPLPKSETRVAVQYEIGKISKIPEEELMIDFWQVQKSAKSKDGNIQLKAFAARKTVIEQHLDQLRVAGLRPRSLESRMLANIEALRFNGYIQPDSQCVLADIGDRTTSIGFIRNGSLQACRAEEVGMGAVNSAFQARFGTDFATSEAKKLAYNIHAEASGSPESDTLEEVYLRVLRAIKDSIESHVENTLDARPESILLVGGGSRSLGIDTAISNLFRIPAIRANPFKNIQIYSGSENRKDEEIGALAPLMTTAVGLALRGIK